jgi:hypothetical protein
MYPLGVAPQAVRFQRNIMFSKQVRPLVRYTPRSENFVLVLEGISRAKPLAS